LLQDTPTIPAEDPMRSESSNVMLQNAYAAKHLQNHFRNLAHAAFTSIMLHHTIKSGVTQAILAIMGHQRPETPTLHRAAYWHLSTVGRPIPKTSDLLKVKLVTWVR